MEKVIIGSTALKYWYPEFPREPSDVDFVVDDKSKERNTKLVEFHLNPVLLKYENRGYITPNMLLTLKVSHMFWDINWEKHLFDIQYLVNKGHTIYYDILDEFIEYWKQNKEHVKRSDLTLSKEEFFTNSVNKNVVEHDTLHTFINPIPMYTRLLAEGKEVELDITKFEAMSHEDKLEVVREETYVMAYERYKNAYYKRGFKVMLKKCILQHFPKEIAIFALLNYIELEEPKINFINKIENGLRKIK